MSDSAKENSPEDTAKPSVEPSANLSDGAPPEARETLRIIRDDPQGAIDRLERRIAAGEADFRTWHNLAVSLAKSGEIERALESVSTALKDNPDSAVSHFLNGMLLKGAGRFKESIAAFDRVEGLDPSYPRLFGNRGVAAFFLGDADGAAADLARAVDHDPSDTVVLFNSAVVAVARKKYAVAQGLFQKLCALEPQRAGHYQKFLVELGRTQVIEETFSQAHRIKNFVGIVGDRLRRFCETELDKLDDEGREDLEAIRDDHEQVYSDLVVFLGAIRPRAMELTTVDLGRLLGRILFVVGGRTAGVEIETDVAEDLPNVHCDVDQLQEAFLNLLLNALDAIQAAGHGAGKGRIAIVARADGRNVRVSVTDNGIGIPEGELDRIFQFGFTTKTLGSGIGLAHTRRIIGEHGGRIEVESNEGEGTTLHCYLPVEPRVSESLANLAVRSQLLEDPRELILEEEGEDLGI